MSPLAAFALSACAAVAPDSDRILLRDVAPAFPDVEISAPEMPVGLAPAPGVERRFDIPELRRIAARLHLESEPRQEICVTRPVAPLDRDRILAAMREQLPAAAIELLDFSHWPAPAGTLEFPLSGLRDDHWTGAVRYAGSRRLAVWARVRVRVSVARAMAARDLRAGERLDSADLRIETVEAAPAPGLYLESASEGAGKRLRRSVRAGDVLRAEWLETPPDVARGETVQVEVRSGAALLAFEGQAQGSGNVGQTISVLNPQTRKRFQARVEARGRVALAGASL